jgi:hypothetical protein
MAHEPSSLHTAVGAVGDGPNPLTQLAVQMLPKPLSHEGQENGCQASLEGGVGQPGPVDRHAEANVREFSCIRPRHGMSHHGYSDHVATRARQHVGNIKERVLRSEVIIVCHMQICTVSLRLVPQA